MAFSGNTGVLDAPGPVRKKLVKDQFLTPTAQDITAVQDTLAMTGDPWTAAEIDTSARTLAAFGGLTKPITLAEVLRVSETLRPYRSAQDVGMVGDGVTDDSFALQQDMDARSAEGGCVYWLQATAIGGSFYLAHAPRVPSNITLICSSPFLLAKDATLFIRGRRAAAANRDAFRLLSDITAEDSEFQIDTAPHGGEALSNYFAVDDYFELVGELDGCATPRTEQECRVTAVDDGTSTITISSTVAVDHPVSYPAGAYEENYGDVNYAIVRKLVFALATADLSDGQTLVEIRAGDVGKLSAGDMVQIKDDTTTDDFAPGSTSAPCFEEYALIVASASGDPASSVRLDRRVTRNFTTAKNLRLVKIDRVQGSTVSGARALSAAAPDLAPAARISWFEMRYAFGCTFDSCTVPNSDVFGKRGTAFNIVRSLDCDVINCDAAKAKYIDDGEGNGIVFDRATGCKATGGTMDSMRHATQCVSGSGNSFHDITVTNPRHVPVDCHGTYEVDCHWYNCSLFAGTQYEVGEGRSPAAIIFGNPTFLAGSHRCGFHGGVAVGFSSDISSKEPVVAIIPGATGCAVDTKAVNCRQAFRFSDVVDYGTIVASGHRIRLQVDGCIDPNLVDIHGRRNGATVDTLVDTRIEIYGRNLNGGFLIRQATEIEIANCDFDEVTIDPSFTYFVEAELCTDLVIANNRTKAMGRGVRLTDCTGYRIYGNQFVDQDNATVLFDAGGNSGIWLDNRAVGPLLPFFTPAATSTITIDGRLPGHWDLADDSVLIIKPVHQKGTAFFSGVSGAAFQALISYDTVTSRCDLGPFTTVNVDGSTSALTGATGTDGRLTISVHNATDTIQIENRLGVTVRVAGRVD